MLLGNNIARALDPDLTPSTNFVTFDYSAIIHDPIIDSIQSGRYDGLVGDIGLSLTYIPRYNIFWARDSTIKLLLYYDINNSHAASASMDSANIFCADSVSDIHAIYWHSNDSVFIWADPAVYGPDTTLWIVPVSVDSNDSRLLTYAGTRYLNNNTDSTWRSCLCSYIDSLFSPEWFPDSTINYSWWGIWGDNSGMPKTLDIFGSSCSDSAEKIAETDFIDSSSFGCERISSAQRTYRDTVFIKYMELFAEELFTRFGN